MFDAPSFGIIERPNFGIIEICICKISTGITGDGIFRSKVELLLKGMIYGA